MRRPEFVPHEIAVAGVALVAVDVVTRAGLETGRVAQRVDDELHAASVGQIEDLADVFQKGQRTGHLLAVDAGAHQQDLVADRIGRDARRKNSWVPAA